MTLLCNLKYSMSEKRLRTPGLDNVKIRKNVCIAQITKVLVNNKKTNEHFVRGGNSTFLHKQDTIFVHKKKVDFHFSPNYFWLKLCIYF